MKCILTLYCLLVFCLVGFGQNNVGIGTTEVTRAKLNVAGTANVNSNTVALFGANAGISLQQAWPTIGFNQYRAIPTGNGYAISTGYGMHMTFNYTNGDFAMLRNGNAATGEPLPLQESFFTFLHGSNTLRLNSEIPNGRAEIPNKVFAAQMGNMNLVPLGVINVTYNYVGGVTQASPNNGVGALYTNYLGSRTGNAFFLKLGLNPTTINGYSKLVVVPGLNFTQVNSGDLFGLETTVLDESPKAIQVKVVLARVGFILYNWQLAGLRGAVRPEPVALSRISF